MSEDLTRVPPHNKAAEIAVIGAVLLENNVLDDVGDLVYEDFYDPAHATIWKAIAYLAKKSRRVDLISLADLLRMHEKLDEVGGLEYLSGILDQVPTTVNVESNARLIKHKAMIRAGIGICLSYQAKGYKADDGPEYLSRLASEAERAVSIRDQGHVQSLAETLPETRREIARQHEAKVEITGVATGFPALDRRTGGLQPSDLIIIAGRPSMGKTALALDILLNCAQREGAGLLFSAEMSKRQQDRRLLSKKSGVPLHKLRTPKWLDGDDIGKLVDAERSLVELPIYVDDSAELTVSDIRARARRLARKVDLKIVVIDYLQILVPTTKGDSRDRQLAEMTRALKALAKELEVPVVLLSQLNRSCDNRPDKRPIIADLRESGAIEQDSDVVMFLYREAAYDPDAGDEAEVIARKNRNGPPGTDFLRFRKALARFEEPADKSTEATEPQWYDRHPAEPPERDDDGMPF